MPGVPLLYFGDSAPSGPPVPPPAMAPADGTDCLASSVAAATLDATALDSSPSPSGDPLEHISSLLDRLPSDLTPDQRERAETIIRGYANVFSCSTSIDTIGLSGTDLQETNYFRLAQI